MMVPILGVVLLILGGTINVHEEPFDKEQFEEMSKVVSADEYNQKKPVSTSTVQPEVELKAEVAPVEAAKEEGQ